MAKLLISAMSRCSGFAPLCQRTVHQPRLFGASLKSISTTRLPYIHNKTRIAKYHATASSRNKSPSTANLPQKNQIDHDIISEHDDLEAAPHVPVLLEEIMGFFQDINVRVYVDGTLGAGGHASQVVSRHPELQTLIGFDLDPLAHQLAGERLAQHGAHVLPVTIDPKTGMPQVEGTINDKTKQENGDGIIKKPTALLVRSNFSAMGSVLPHLSLTTNTTDTTTDSTSSTSVYGQVDAMLLDLGISSMQVDLSERGFSFMRAGPLDMRMDPEAVLSAEVAVNSWSEAQLGKIIKEFGEERYWKSIARRIASAREEAPIVTTHQLVKAIGNPGGYGGGGGRGSKEKKHPATRTFQALRIAVNGELQSVAEAIPAAVEALAPGGRLAVITFHSLEDRIVKWAFRQAAGMAPTDEPLPSYCNQFDASTEGEALVKILTRRPVVPGGEEQVKNPRSRSAKLRVVEKLA